MGIITLTSDWGIKNHYVAAVKGAILSHVSDVTIVDVSHEISPFDTVQASFIIKNSYKNFPEGTVHIIGINTEASIKTPHTVVFADGHYFIGADNGIFSLILDKKPDKIIELNIIQDTDYFTFSTRDVFVKVACHIIKGGKMEELGNAKESIVENIHLEPAVDADTIRGIALYIDSYENVITNINEKLFTEVGKGKTFTISFRAHDYEITTISKAYNDVPEGEMLALFGSTGYLEIAINKGNAASLLGLTQNDSIRIEFVG